MLFYDETSITKNFQVENWFKIYEGLKLIKVLVLYALKYEFLCRYNNLI